MKTTITNPSPGTTNGGSGGGYFGTSTAMRAVDDLVTQAAKHRRHLLVSGEAGTDRESVAREVHRRDASRPAVFVKVSGAAPSPAALEQELFGYQGSAAGVPPMVGQMQERRSLERIARGGLLHQALGGTIFIEHLPQIPARLQARVARLLRDGEAVVVNQRESVVLNIRAIVAVEETYEQDVREGRIRDDLHQLVSGVRIAVPPLRRRREDIAGLACRLADDLSVEANVPRKTLSEPAQQLLAALPWPGNTLQLKDLILNLVVRVPGEVIELLDLLKAVPLDGRTRDTASGGTLREARERFERDYITSVLELHKWRVPDAARTLGIQRTNLYRKLRQLKISPGGSKA